MIQWLKWLMKMCADFAKLAGSGKYPKPFNSANEDQSTGQIYPYKINTGNTRGTQTVGFGNVKIDGANNKISLSDTISSLTLGDLNEENKSFGLGVYDDKNDLRIIAGKTPTEDYGLAVYDDTDTMRLLAGKYSNGGIKIKLSQTGYDVTTATDNQLIWSSDFNMFKIIQTGTVSTSAFDVVASSYDSSQVTVDISSLGLSDPPIIMSFVQDGATLRPVPYTYLPSFGVTAGHIVHIQMVTYEGISQASTLYFTTTRFNASGGTVSQAVTTYRYYILAETLL